MPHRNTWTYTYTHRLSLKYKENLKERKRGYIVYPTERENALKGGQT